MPQLLPFHSFIGQVFSECPLHARHGGSGIAVNSSNHIAAIYSVWSRGGP